MWGYYASGFKGVVIEIKIDRSEVTKISYIDIIHSWADLQTSNNVQKILTSKLTQWKHESEYRFLVMSQEKEHRIGTITAVYFGEPYSDMGNRNEIYTGSPILRCYKYHRDRLINIAIKQHISIKSVSITNNGKIEINPGMMK
jgi:hypothetical protein